MWTPIENSGQLPALGTRESPTLDFKKVPTDDAFEVAKDAAAFANAQGGTFLVGAAGGDHLVRFEPLDAETARVVARAYEVAIGTRCKPTPLFTVKDLAVGGGAVIVVNVWPFPGQVVGVSLTKAETPIEGAHYFAIRVGTDTKAITPEQIPMFMDAKLRRVAMSLQAALGKPAILFDATSPSVALGAEQHADIGGVDLMGNAVGLRLYENQHDVVVSLPLDMVETAYLDGQTWHLHVRGRFVYTGNKDRPFTFGRA